MWIYFVFQLIAAVVTLFLVHYFFKFLTKKDLERFDRTVRTEIYDIIVQLNRMETKMTEELESRNIKPGTDR